MPITTYSELKTEIADYYNRTDLTSKIDNFIDQCEAELQIRCKLLEFETDSTLTVTAGVATLPTGWLDARTLVWQSNPKKTLRYLTPDRVELINAVNQPGTANYYTIVGSQLRFADDVTGTVIVTYKAKFTPLSDSATSNAILSNYPSAYLYGSMKHAAIFCKDVSGATGYSSLFDQQIALIIQNDKERKYAGASLEVKVG